MVKNLKKNQDSVFLLNYNIDVPKNLKNSLKMCSTTPIPPESL